MINKKRPKYFGSITKTNSPFLNGEPIEDLGEFRLKINYQ